jgi:hypothetical protein
MSSMKFFTLATYLLSTLLLTACGSDQQNLPTLIRSDYLMPLQPLKNGSPMAVPMMNNVTLV